MKPPRKRRRPARHEPEDSEKEVERQTEAKAELVPPARRPPTAVGAETPPPPPHPRRGPLAPVPERRRPVLLRMVEALRQVVEAMLDVADAAAEAITKPTEGRRVP